MTNTILVLGATGGIGGEVARAFLKRGWRVKALTRRPEQAAASRPDLTGVEWVDGDAMNAASVTCHAAGAQIIFHGAHPANYANWEEWGIPMFQNSMAAAKEAGARLILPGNIYNFGPDAGSFVAETAPQHPLTVKGAIRVRMERMLADASRDGVRSLVVRAADFIGPRSPSSWFGTAMVKPGKRVRAITYPGRADIGHGFAYLPDLAEAIARLAEIDGTLAPFEVVHFGGHWFDRGSDFIDAVGRAAGLDGIKVRRFPWFAIFLARPVWGLARGLWEMRYLWREPLRLDNAKLVSLIGPEPHTPTDAMLRATLQGMGCLPAREPVRRLAAA
ncbi:MAG TPA: NAD(P)H-binding protein [Stellaceae bacterium]|nr:NAD(P)H-binding protein [Stellaceae bacterium]